MSASLSPVNNNIQVLINQIESIKAPLVLSLNNANLTTDQKIDLTNRIAQLDAIKTSLLQQLVPAYSAFNTNVEISNDTLNKQILAREIIADETKNSERQLRLLNLEKLDKVKLTDINTYYSKKYNAHKQIMKTIVLICIPIIILTILGNKGLVPNTIIVLLLSFIIVFGIITIAYQIIDLSNRDNMNYDAYDWKFTKSMAPAPPSDTNTPYIENPWSLPTFDCIGAACCDTTTQQYNEIQKLCLPKTATTTPPITNTPPVTNTPPPIN